LDTIHSKFDSRLFKDSKVGEYIIGCDPADECGLSKIFFLENNCSSPKPSTTNDFQFATNRILAYAYDELLVKYDIFEFYKTTNDPLETVPIRERMNDPEAYTYSCKQTGVF
jgi:hypothetical protein